MVKKSSSKKPLSKAAENSHIKLDGLGNVVTSLGISGRARTPSSKISDPKGFTPQELGFMYAGDGFAKRIIDLIAEEMTREWVELNGDLDGYLLKYLEKLDAQKHFCDLVRWARLFGGAIIIIGANDGKNLDEELNLSNIKTIEFLRVIDRAEIFTYPQDYYSDPADPKFGQVEYYTIKPYLYGVPVTNRSIMYRVHNSRILRLDGDIVPNFMKRINKGWGFSVLQVIYSNLIGLLQGYEYSSEIIHDFLVHVFSIKNLSSILQTASGEERIKKRMEIVNYSKSILNAVTIDSDAESYEKISTNLTGLTDLVAKLEMAVASVTGIPYMILMGKSPSGLSATGDNEIRGWYDRINMMQEQQIRPALRKLLEILVLTKDCEFKGDIDDVTIEFKPLWQYEQKDLVAMRFQQAQTDAIYLERGVLQEEEVRNSRFADNYSFTTKLSEDTDLTSSSGDDELMKEIKQTQEMLKVRPGFASVPFGSGQQNLTVAQGQPQGLQSETEGMEEKTDSEGDLPFKEKIKVLLQKMLNLVKGK